MLTEEKIAELITEYGGDREYLLLIEDKLNILGIPQDENYLELLEEVYSYYMSSKFIAIQNSRDINGIINSKMYNNMKISIDEAIINVFNNKFSKKYNGLDDIIDSMPIRK